MPALHTFYTDSSCEQTELYDFKFLSSVITLGRKLILKSILHQEAGSSQKKPKQPMKISRLTKLHQLQEWGFVATFFLFGILNGCSYCFQCFNAFNAFNFCYHVPDSRMSKTVGSGPKEQQNHATLSEKVIPTILLLWVFQK